MLSTHLICDSPNACLSFYSHFYLLFIHFPLRNVTSDLLPKISKKNKELFISVSLFLFLILLSSVHVSAGIFHDKDYYAGDICVIGSQGGSTDINHC